MRTSLFLAISLLLGLLHTGEEQVWAGNPLISAQDLARKLAANETDNLVLLDTRPKEAIEAGHIRRAISADLSSWAAASIDEDQTLKWSERLGALGIDADTTVVVVDETVTAPVARAWWLLRHWGVEKAFVLDGGMKAWKAEVGESEIEKGETASPIAKEFKAKEDRSGLATRQDTLAAIRSKDVQILDVRSYGEFCGADILKNKRSGAIPGAVNLEWKQFVHAETGKLKSDKEIQSLLKDVGIDPSKPILTHCQSGGRASVAILALELIGAKQPRNYYAGWADWNAAEDTPVEQREAPKK